jgi:hypothetical protein
MSAIHPYFSGYADVRYLIVFGASLEATEYPWSNFSAANGPTQIHFLSEHFNKSDIQRINYADPGATTSRKILRPTRFGFGFIRTLEEQIDAFLKTYPKGGSLANWDASNSLFFFGSHTGNDILMSYYRPGGTPIAELTKKTGELFDRLYEAGARNFVWLSIAPVHLAPFFTNHAKRRTLVPSLSKVVEDFQTELSHLAKQKREQYPDIALFQPDFTPYFAGVQSNPGAFVATAGYKDTMGYCEEYRLLGLAPWSESVFGPFKYLGRLKANGLRGVPHKAKGCELKPEEYMFLNPLHYTSPLHELHARFILDTIGETGYLTDGEKKHMSTLETHTNGEVV